MLYNGPVEPPIDSLIFNDIPYSVSGIECNGYLLFDIFYLMDSPPLFNVVPQSPSPTIESNLFN